MVDRELVGVTSGDEPPGAGVEIAEVVVRLRGRRAQGRRGGVHALGFLVFLEAD